MRGQKSQQTHQVVMRTLTIWRHLSVNLGFWVFSLLYVGLLDSYYLESMEGVATRYNKLIWLVSVSEAIGFCTCLAISDAAVQSSNFSKAKIAWSLCLGALYPFLLIDLCLFQTIAIHLPTAARLLSEAGFTQTSLTLEATGIRREQWMMAGGLVLISSILVGWLYRYSWRKNDIWVYKFHFASLVGTVVIIFTVVTLGERVCRGNNPWEKGWEEVHRVMPLTINLLNQTPGARIHSGALRKPQPLPQNSRLLKSKSGVATRPDIFIFVIESLRGDYVGPEAAPSLAKLREDCIPFRNEVANGNATQISWFSLLTSRQPLYFSIVKHDRSLWGSAPLLAFRELGYSIHVLAATFLHYHAMDQIVFGESRELATSFLDAGNLAASDRPGRDREVTAGLLEELPKKSGGRLFFIFYDSTHHDYFWPDDFAPKFTPYAKSWNYFDFAINREELQMIKNRYRNSVNFVDSLMGTFISALKRNDRYEDSVICVMGDHGEEFLEHGKLVHASELWREQTHIPIFLKLAKGISSHLTNSCGSLTASHIDILPTILDALGSHLTVHLDGESLFTKKKDFVVTADDNGDRDPFRFSILNGDRKAWLRYKSDATLISLDTDLFLTKVTDSMDYEVTARNHAEELAKFGTVFGDAMTNLFPRWKQ